MTYTFKQIPEFTHALSKSVLETCNIDLLLNKERELPVIQNLNCLRNVNVSTIFGRRREKHSQKIVLLSIASKFGPQEVNRFSQLCA